MAKRCKVCGCEMSNNSLFCSSCGSNLLEDSTRDANIDNKLINNRDSIKNKKKAYLYLAY